MKKYKPEAKHVKDDFYAVEATDWLPVNKKGEVLLDDGTKHVYTLKGNRNYERAGGTFIHRAVPLTFLECPGDPEDFQVNHKDGNKVNNKLENLEWCTRSENSIHAYATGLRNDNRPMYAKNLETNEVLEFYSLQQCARYFKVNGSLIYFYLKGKRDLPWRKKWTFTRKGEEWPNLTKEDVGRTKGLAKDIVSVNEETNKAIIYPGISAASKVTGINNGTLGWYLNKKGVENTNLYKGERWYFLDEYMGDLKEAKRLGTVKKNPNNLAKRKPSKVKRTDLSTGESVVWNSLQEIANHLGMKKNTIEKGILVNSGTYRGYKYEYLGKDRSAV